MHIIAILVLCFTTSSSTTNALVTQSNAQGQNKCIDRKYSNDIKAASLLLPPRCDALRRAFLFAPMIAANIIRPPANALEACRPKSHNCIRTTFTAPSSVTSSIEVVNAVRDVLNSYPQKGQAGVDCSGWRIVNDSLDNPEVGSIKLEYKSCVGPAVLAINLGQPFIDDLVLELGKKESSFMVEVKSSSRMGSSDLGVNRKRLEYLGRKLKERGWVVPSPKYVYEF